MTAQNIDDIYNNLTPTQKNEVVNRMRTFRTTKESAMRTLGHLKQGGKIID